MIITRNIFFVSLHWKYIVQCWSSFVLFLTRDKRKLVDDFLVGCCTYHEKQTNKQMAHQSPTITILLLPPCCMFLSCCFMENKEISSIQSPKQKWPQITAQMAHDRKESSRVERKERKLLATPAIWLVDEGGRAAIDRIQSDRKPASFCLLGSTCNGPSSIWRPTAKKPTTRSSSRPKINRRKRWNGRWMKADLCKPHVHFLFLKILIHGRIIEQLP